MNHDALDRHITGNYGEDQFSQSDDTYVPDLDVLDAFGRSTTMRCKYCKQPLYWSEDTRRLICLNACDIPMGAWRRVERIAERTET